MSKVPQKLERKKSEIYQDAPIAKFGERKPDNGRVMINF